VSLRHLGLAVLLATTLLLTLPGLLPMPALVPPAAPTEASLPPVPTLEVAQPAPEDLAVLHQSALFGAPAGAGADGAAPRAPTWTVVGTSTAADAATVFVHVNSDTERTLVLHAGDSLPDGAKIVSVDRDGVCVAGREDAEPRRILVNAFTATTTCKKR
jgi:hypothetical protein